MYGCVLAGTHNGTCVCGPEDSLFESVLSVHRGGLQDGTEVVGSVGGWCHYLLSHLSLSASAGFVKVYILY